MSRDNENPFAYEPRTTGGRANDSFNDYENPFPFHTETTTAASRAGQKSSNGDRISKLQRWNTILRLAAFAMALLAVLLMALAKQSSNVTVEDPSGKQSQANVVAKYKYNDTFVFFLWINLVVAVYALMMTVLSFLMLQKGSTGESHPKVMWIFFVLNVLAIFALVLVFAAALAIEVANRNGMTLTGNAGYVHWRAMCKDFNTFCSVVECSFAACGLAFLALIAGTFLDGYFIHKNYSD